MGFRKNGTDIVLVLGRTKGGNFQVRQTNVVYLALVRGRSCGNFLSCSGLSARGRKDAARHTSHDKTRNFRKKLPRTRNFRKKLPRKIGQCSTVEHIATVFVFVFVLVLVLVLVFVNKARQPQDRTTGRQGDRKRRQGKARQGKTRLNKTR